jgi:adenylyltransferase/sulfurtransferase
VSGGLAKLAESEALLVALNHCEAAYPSEGCGVFIQTADGSLAALPLANAIDHYHRRDPARFPRTSASGYLFNPAEQQRVFEAAERSGGRIAAIFHSHPDRGAYFSEEDKVNALAAGEPLFPGVEYLVVSVVSGRSAALNVFSWQGREWVERGIPLPKRPQIGH